LLPHSLGFSSRGVRPAIQPDQIESLAVLPLENLSGDSSQDYFTDGMTEALIAELSKVGALRVISRTSVMKYKGSRKLLPEIARELDVDVIVEGSVIRSGERVRITAQLIQAATDIHLWAENYERNAGDILTLQKEVARVIAREIKIKVTPQEQARLSKTRPVNPEAYDLFLRGVFHSHRFDKADNQTGIEMLDRAVALDPSFAAGHAALANACVFRLFYVAPEEQEQLEEKAYVELEKAHSSDPDLAEIYLARGKLLWTRAKGFPHERAIQEYRRALELNPNLEDALNQLALVHSHIGLFDEALQETQRMAAINRNLDALRRHFGNVFLWQGKYEQALTSWLLVERAGLPSYTGAHIAWALFQLGRKDEAAAKLEEFLKLDPTDTGGNLSGMQAMLFAAAGEKRKAKEKIKHALERRNSDTSIIRLLRRMCLRADERARAVNLLVGAGGGHRVPVLPIV